MGAGLARALGVSNFSCRKLRALLDDPRRSRPVSVLQAEAHPFWPNAQLVAACAAAGVHFTAYSALARAAAARQERSAAARSTCARARAHRRQMSPRQR